MTEETRRYAQHVATKAWLAQQPCEDVAAATSHPKTELRRVTVHEHDDRNGCETVRGVGFSWRCTCGARGPIQGSRDAALASKREHERGHR